MEFEVQELDEFEKLNSLKNTEYTRRLLANKQVFYDLQKAWGPTWHGLCGGYLFTGREYKLDTTSYEKQELLYAKAKTAKRVLEVGSYVGHSLFIMLLANPNLEITSIDIDDKYTGPAVKVLEKHFGTSIRFLHTDSLTGCKQLIDEGEKFDLFHLDGDHNEDLIIQEYGRCSKLSSCYPKVKILFDDEMSMRGFSHYLLFNRSNVKIEMPNCSWSNMYIEFDEPEVKREH